jgi:hypothetical protein
VVAEAYVGKNLVMKRFHARARGRVGRIQKPFSNLTIVVRREVEESRLMGQKVNPIGCASGSTAPGTAAGSPSAEYAKLLHEDFRIREYLRQEPQAGWHQPVVIERPHKKCRVTIYSARPGVVIGKKGADIERLRAPSRR